MTTVDAPARKSVRWPLKTYAAIVVTYVALMGWWVYFFSTQDTVLARRIADAGDPLSEAQLQDLSNATGDSMRMFFFEGSFVGLLIIGSVYLVFRAMHKEILLHREQRNFLLAVSHELRSPISSARLYVQSIALGRTDEEKTARYLQHAREDLDRLGTMVENILTTRRMTEGEVRVRPESVDLARMTGRLLPHLLDIHAQGAAEIRYSGSEDPVPARVDASALDRILDNLLSNAVKYGGERPSVDVTVRSDGERAVLAVRDHGPGLNGSDPDALVQPFVRGGDERVRTAPGIGLGLSIVRELARAHGGELRLADAAGGGVEVTVSFPACPLEEVGQAAFAAAGSSDS